MKLLLTRNISGQPPAWKALVDTITIIISVSGSCLAFWGLVAGIEYLVG